MNGPSDKILWHETPVFATNGTVFPLDFGQVLQIASSRLFCVSLFTYLVALSIAQSEIYSVSVGLHIRLIYMLVNGVLTVTIWLALLGLLSWVLSILFRTLPIPTMLLHLLTMSIMVGINRWVFGQVFGAPYDPNVTFFVIEMLRYSALILAFEFLVVVFLLPRFDWIMAITTNKDGSIPIAPTVLMASGLEIPTRKIRHLKSVEHYVEITTDDGTQMVRAALRDLIDQLDGLDGAQPHRSHWVTYGAVVQIAKENGSIVLELNDGTVIPVSRGRRKEIQAWFDRPG